MVWLTPSGVRTWRGDGIGAWLDWLVPRLNGGTDLNDLIARMPPDRQRIVHTIIDRLGALGVLDETGTAPAAGVLLTGSENLVRMAVDMAVRAGLDNLRPMSYAHAGFEDAVAGAEVTVHLCEAGDAHRLDHLCVERDATVLHAVLLGRFGCVAPIAAAPGIPWEAVRARLSLPNDDGGDDALARLLIAQALQYAREQDPQRAWVRRAALIDGDRAEVMLHPLTPYPMALAKPATASRTAGPFSERVVALVDTKTGIVADVGEAGYPQIPLHVSEARVRAPGRPDTRSVRLVAGGATFAEAREAAVRRALEWYAVQCFDERRTGRTVPGRRLPDGVPRSVRADDVFALRAPAAVPAGVGSGDSWDGAVLAGLLSQVAAAAGVAIDDPVPELVLTQTGSTDAAVPDLAGLKDLGLRAVVADLTGQLGVPTAGIVIGGVLTAVASGLSPRHATTAAARAALLRRQLGVAESNPRYVSIRRASQADAVEGELTVEEIVLRLEKRGHTPTVVALDHDPAIGIALPAVVRVLLHE